MNILLIVPTDPSVEHSGTEQRTAALYRALSSLGTVYTVLPVKRLEREFLDAERRVQGICFLPASCRGKHLLRSVFKWLVPYLTLPLIGGNPHERVFPGVRFDCVVVHYLDLATKTQPWRFGPCFVDVDDLPIEQYKTGPAKHHGPLRRLLARHLFRRWTDWVGRHLAGIWVTSERHRHLFPHLPTTLLPNIARSVPADFPFWRRKVGRGSTACERGWGNAPHIQSANSANQPISRRSVRAPTFSRFSISPGTRVYNPSKFMLQ